MKIDVYADDSADQKDGISDDKNFIARADAVDRKSEGCYKLADKQPLGNTLIRAGVPLFGYLNNERQK